MFAPSFHGALFSFFKRFNLFIFREGKGGRQRERNISVWLPLVRPLLGTCPKTQPCALTGNSTSNPLVCWPALNPLSHTRQGSLFFFLLYVVGHLTLGAFRMFSLPSLSKIPHCLDMGQFYSLCWVLACVTLFSFLEREEGRDKGRETLIGYL